MLGLTLVGAPHPTEIPDGVPPAFHWLLSTWGAGRLCGAFDVPDAERFRTLQTRLRVHGAAERAAGHWAQLDDARFSRAIVLAVGLRGITIVSCGTDELLLLRPDGTLRTVPSLEALVGQMLDKRAQHDVFGLWDADLGVPAVYATAPLPRADVLAAIATGDEAIADAKLARHLESEIALFANLDLALALIDDDTLPREPRANYLDQCLRAVKRRGHDKLAELPVRDIANAVRRATAVVPTWIAPLRELASVPPIFAAPADAAEQALLDALAKSPDDATRLVLADHLEEHGDLAHAEALRASAIAKPLADATERGFVAPSHYRPVDGAAMLREALERWRTDDPDTSIAPLVARIDALHPTARQGYALLVTMLAEWSYGQHARGHLQRELPDAWPWLVLVLRTTREVARIVELFVAHKLRDVAPYLRSIVRHPGEISIEHYVAVVEAFVRLGKVDPALADEYLPYLDAAPTPSRRHREAAYVLLRERGADDRVFDGYLRHFVDAYPHSLYALRKRKTDPRIEARLLELFAIEEKHSLIDGKHVRYSQAYGVLARALSKLGNARGKEAAKRFNYRANWGKSGWPDEDL